MKNAQSAKDPAHRRFFCQVGELFADPVLGSLQDHAGFMSTQLSTANKIVSGGGGKFVHGIYRHPSFQVCYGKVAAQK